MSLLECTNVTKRFGGLTALNQVELMVEPGEIVGLVGPNGSGKTTLLSAIAGSLRATSGRIIFDGHDITRASANRRAHAGIARTFQVPRPLSSFTVMENVATAAMFGRHGVARGTAVERARAILARVGLDRVADYPVSALTLHERKFVEVSRALALEPKLILLDEVLGGLNPAETAEGIELISSLRDHGTAVIYIEHNVKAVTQLADRLYVLHRGRNLAGGNPAETIADERVVNAYVGRSDA